MVKVTTFLFGLLALVPSIASAKWEDKSALGTVELATCTAAVMKSGMGIDAYEKWSNALHRRYQRMHPSKSTKEIDKYTAERIVDKRAELQRKGISTTVAFKRFYEMNCIEAHP